MFTKEQAIKYLLEDIAHHEEAIDSLKEMVANFDKNPEEALCHYNAYAPHSKEW